VQKNFNVGPQHLDAQPHAATQSQERPEQPGTRFGSPDVAKDGEHNKRKKKALRKIANGGQLITTRNDKGNDGLKGYESRRKNPTLLPRGDGGAHTLILGVDEIPRTLRKSSRNLRKKCFSSGGKVPRVPRM